MQRRVYGLLFAVGLMSILPAAVHGQASFVNWENLGVHSMDMTPDGTRLLVANTADNRLEVFDVSGAGLVHLGAVPVGLDPVAVRARTNDEVWVANHVSDSISVVDLTTMNVVATLSTADEPTDLVFAGTLGRAFVTCSQANLVQVFDPSDLTVPPIEIPIAGEDPRAMAVSPDGSTVYVAVFESSNATTILGGGLDSASPILFPPNVVNNPAGPWGGMNPPPNAGNAFSPPQRPGNPPPPRVGLIVRKNELGHWLDDNGGDWTEFVTGARAADSGRVIGWDMPDRDLAIIDADSLSITYATGLMNICMAVGVNPASGDITVVGTEAINEVRFEPNVNGVLVRVHMATVDAANPANKTIVDLNPHLDYSVATLPQSERDKSIGDPRSVVWTAAGTRGYVAGMGSNNVIVIDPAGARAGLSQTIEVGEGPIALALDEPRGRLYVFNRFEGSISIVDTVSELEVSRVALFDPSPAALKLGRKHFYDTRKTSGLGQAACASCHVDARTDRLAWDLGDPAGTVASLAGNNLGAGILGLRPGTTSPPFEDFHPMKGPMTTQTLQDIIGHEPHHWRGDRTGLEAFNPAFVGLLGDDVPLTQQEMQEFEDFLATIYFPPNPFREFDNSLPTSLPLPGNLTTGRFGPAGQPLPNGNAENGRLLYTSLSRRLDGGAFACVTCHTLPTGGGTDYRWTGSSWAQLPLGPLGEHHQALVSVDGSTNHAIKTPQLRNSYEKIGFNAMTLESNAGFGVLHDGSIDTFARFVAVPVFNVRSDQEVADLVAFILSISGSDFPAGPLNHPLAPPGTPSQDTHAAVGTQLTLDGSNNNDPAVVALIAEMLLMDETLSVGVVVKGRQNGIARGYAYLGGGLFFSDRASEIVSADALRQSAAPDSELTWTVVPRGAKIRIGIDRDEDGFFDRDELDACSDPADPTVTPLNVVNPGDLNCDCSFNGGDIDPFFLALGDPVGYAAAFPNCNISNADMNGDGLVNGADIDAFFKCLGGGACP